MKDDVYICLFSLLISQTETDSSFVDITFKLQTQSKISMSKIELCLCCSAVFELNKYVCTCACGKMRLSFSYFHRITSVTFFVFHFIVGKFRARICIYLELMLGDRISLSLTYSYFMYVYIRLTEYVSSGSAIHTTKHQVLNK